MSDDDAEQLTSADIFGDMLAEVEAEARGSKPASRSRKASPPTGDIERKLEETLSGVIPSAGKKRRAQSPSAEAPAKSRRRRAASTESEIDDLLDQTLSSLDIPTRSKRSRRSATPTPAAGMPPSTDALPDKDSSPADVESPPLPEPESQAHAPTEPSPASFEVSSVEPEEASALSGKSALGTPPAESAFEPAGSWSATAPDEASPPGVAPVLDEPQSPADQFRTMQLPTLDLAAGAQRGEIFGDYTLLDRIAVGGMAEVWRARRRGVEGFQKTVAIKKILSHLTGSKDFVTMFIDEAKLAAQLSHNNIIQIYDLGKVGEDFFIAMEHVDGKDLRSILTAAQETRRPVPVGLGLLIVSAVARALDYAHRKRDFDGDAMGLVHRDVSPQNVMISFEGAIKLCDFGIVKAVAKASTTQMGALKGKLQYMSPEQAWGKSVDARSDIFSLGSVLYEVLTGTQLFSGESEIGVLDAVRECRISSPRTIVSEIPEEVAEIVLRALAKSPEERYQTAGDLEHDIRAVLDDFRPMPSQKVLATYLRSLFEVPASGAVAITAPATAAEPPEPAMDEAPAGASSRSASEEPVAGRPAAAEVSAEPAESRGALWKWLAAAVLAGILIGAGFLAMSRLSRQPSPATPGADPPASVERATSPTPTALPVPSESVGVELPDAQAAVIDDAEAADATNGAGVEDAAEQDPAASAPEEETGVGPPVTAAGIDIEKMVNEELTSRAERLRRDFEAEKKRIEEELARTQEESPPPPAGEKDEGGGGTGGGS